jgi:hypothetical protein
MSDEQRKDEDTEVEAHLPRHSSPRHSANEEPRAEGEEDDEVEAHVRKSSPRHSLPRHA